VERKNKILPAGFKKKLEYLYNRYNRRNYVHPDPLEFLYSYNDIKDREIVAFTASALAYGRVKQILKSVSKVLNVLDPSPYLFLTNSTFKSMSRKFEGFKHRFASGDHMAVMLWGLKKTIERFGSLNRCFLHGMSDNDDTVLPAMIFFAKELNGGRNKQGHLVPLPEKGSACKRMNLFLRWMVRKDEVDPGGWQGISPEKLIIPLDTHMHKIGLKFGFTEKKQANMSTAMEITSSFKKITPDDPVKYDFVLTRFGIRDDMDIDNL